MFEVLDTWIVWVSGIWMQCLKHWNMMNDSGFFILEYDGSLIED